MEFKSLDQIRARTAWADINEVPKRSQPKYRSLIRSLPSMVQSIGVGQVYAFLRANQDKDEFNYVLNHLSRWLQNAQSVPWAEKPEPEPDEVFSMLLQEKSELWWQAGTEAIEYCAWLKRYAEAEFPSQDESKKAVTQSAAQAGQPTKEE